MKAPSSLVVNAVAAGACIVLGLTLIMGAFVALSRMVCLP